MAKINPFTGTTGDYNLQIDRDLRKKYSVDQLSFGREIRRRQKADVKFTPRLVRWLDQSYTFGANYEENSGPYPAPRPGRGRQHHRAAVQDP